MIVGSLFAIIAAAYGASIPPQPVIPTSSVCLQGCFESFSVVNAAFDLFNFKSIAVDIEQFCRINADLLKCGRECPAEQIRELEARTEASSYVCLDKIEEFRLVSDCLEKADDMTEKCALQCEVPREVPLRFDSSPASSINPTVLLDGAGRSCKNHICVMKCAQKGFNDACPGAGDLFKDLAKQQVRSGSERLAEDSNNDNVTTVKVMAESYLRNLPTECSFLKDVEEFNKVMEPETTKESEANVTTIASVMTEETKAEAADVTEATTPEMASKMTTESEAHTGSEQEMNTTPAQIEVPSSTAGAEDFIKPDEMAPEVSMATIKPDEELRTVPLPEEALEPSTSETPVERKPEDTFSEKTEIGMDVNSVDQTTAATTEPVIVVDDAVVASVADDNDVQAGVKEEVKSSSSGPFVLSSLFAIAALLFV
ncbi:unnamed protein product [Cylicocyclus nassatus]|uniref:Chondroitin proteoglycan 4 domain-containing protein n=1 Tax=Cylicocyclus nassatus TaxID=53992 RepID=A0AA36GF70_CYLNA|nr:unnamed protein product [Cylicocyclus nassatus]